MTKPSFGFESAPLAPTQQRFWLNEQLYPGTAINNVAVSFLLDGLLDAARFEDAVAAVVANQPGLLVQVDDSDDEPRQLFNTDARVPVAVVDIRHLAVHRQRVIDEIAAVPFDVRAAPLIRMYLLREAADRHVFVIVLHHLVGDGWSLGVFTRELTQAYNRLVEGEEPALAPPPGSYAEYARLMANGEVADRLRHQADYWTSTLDSSIRAVTFPSERPRSRHESTRGKTCACHVDAHATAAIDALARSLSVSRFSVLLSALAVLLGRYSGRATVPLGFPVANRRDRRFARVVGPFMNTGVLQARWGGRSFAELAAETHRGVNEAIAHQAVPFEWVFEAISVATGDGSPLFGVMCIYQNMTLPPLQLTGVTSVPHPAATGVARFDVTLVVELREGGLELTFEYRADVYSEAEVEQLADSYRTLLRAAVSDPHQPCAALRVMRPALEEHVTRRLAGTRVVAVRWPSACHAIAAAAARHPERDAVLAASGSRSYGELVKMARSVGARLRARGVGRGDRVAVYMERSELLVAVLLGIWDAGAAYVPLDASQPDERLRYILADSTVALLLSDDAGGRLGPCGIPVADPRSLANADDSPPAAPPGPDDLAYVMYTSGSSGRPKGVAVTHGNVASFLQAMQEQPGMRAGETLLAITPISFDISVLEMFLPLVSGARVNVVERRLASDGRALAALVEGSGPCVVQATPSTWRMLFDAGLPRVRGLRALCGGEMMSRDLAAALLDRADEVWNLYGPTETTVWSTVARIGEQEPVPTIGRPITNTRCYVVDEHARPVPPGVTGELVIGGCGVASGYWNNPGLTRERFVPDPVDPGLGTVYRTGDLAWIGRDGRLHLRGRGDQQVKLRGHRIELMEIERTLLEHPGVAHAAVLFHEASGGDPRIVAVAEAPRATVPELLSFLRRRLPEVMVPSELRGVARIPLTPNGKVDRLAARGLFDGPEAGSGAPAHPPEGDAERFVAELWAELLGRPARSIDAEQSFFALGGNSLTAVRLLGRFERATGARINLVDFSAEPTVRGLARVAAPVPDADAGAQAPPAPAPAPGDGFPMSFAHRRFWLMDQLDPAGGQNVSVAVWLAGPLAVEVLERAFTAVVERHVGLCSSFEVRDGEMVRVPRRVTPVLDFVDCTGLPPLVRDGAVERLIGEEAQRRFSLAAPPHARLRVIAVGPDRWVLLLTAHHAVLDNWSLGVVAGEICELAAADLRSAVPALPPVALDAAGYARWQRERDAAGAFDAAVEYWARRLEGYAGVAELPTDRPRAPQRNSAGALARLRVAPPVRERLEAAAAAGDGTLFMVLLAALHTVIHRFAGLHDVVVGVPVANRDRPAGVEGLVDCVVDTLPVRCAVDPARPFAEHLRAVRDTWLEALSHPHAPFERIVARLGLERDLSVTPLVQTMLVLQNGPPVEFRFPGVTARGTMADTGTARYDLTFMLWPGDGGLDGVIEYSTALFDAATVERWSIAFRAVLEAVAHDPSPPLGEIGLAGDLPGVAPDPALRERFVADVPAHESVRGHAATHPLATAVRFGAASMTYAELDRRSDDVAAALLNQGVGAAAIVAVLLPAGFAQITGILGVMKAGAAFVVLDDRDPATRQREVAADAAAACLLTGSALPSPWEGEDGPATPTLVLDERGGPVRGPAGAGRGPEPAPQLPRVAAGDPMFLVYTSGSTGAPKGIPQRHETIAQFAEWQRHRYGVDRSSRVALWAPFSYDAAYTEVFLALCSGAVLCIPTPAVRGDAPALLEWMESERVTHLELVPSFARALADAVRVSPATGRRQRAPELRHLLLAGEALHREVIEAWAAACPHVAVHNCYGPTECILATECEVSGGGGDPRDRVPIGDAIPGRQVLVLDAAMRPSPVGAVGFLYIRSPFLAGTYWNRPDETRRAYVADPFDPTGRGVLYRTGDRGRWRAPGVLEFAGRVDGQVKVRGNRVEIEEIEAALERDPRVLEAAARVFEDGVRAEIIGYVVARPGERADDRLAKEVRDRLAAALPQYMTPNRVVVLDALPKTRTNKRNRLALRRPPRDPESQDPPVGELEQAVAAVWCGVLGVAAVARNATFFECGGNSLAATQVQTLLADRLGREVRLVDVFAHPTIAGFARFLESGTVPDPAPRARAAQRRRQAQAAAPGRDRRQAALARLANPSEPPVHPEEEDHVTREPR